MFISSMGRRARLVLVTGVAALTLAIPATVSADTTGGVPSIQPAGSHDATIVVASISVIGKVVANARISVVCQPFDSYDWNTGETFQTTDGSVEFANVTLLQAQGRTLDYGSIDFGGRAVCDGSTVNHYEVPVSAAVSPWKNGAAVAGATIYIADLASFHDYDSASTGPVSVKLTLH
jgi:hypothetical protein